MSPDFVISIGKQAIELCIVMVSVILLPALVVGLLVSMFQAATQINEMTLSFIPKLLVVFITLFVAGSWMLQLIVNYTRRLIEDIPSLIS
jgi:flagellar biosynthetic protein FliQ